MVHVNEVWCRPCPTNLHSPTHNNPHTTTLNNTQQHTQHNKNNNNFRSHFGSSRGHSWPGLSQWLPRHLPWVWFEATRAALHVWPVVGADGHVRTACVMLVGLATTTIWRGSHLVATLLRRLAALMPRLLLMGLRVVFVAWNESWSRSGVCLCHRS